MNANVPKDRYRLSLAHELGHMVMHTYPNPDIEEQAFQFAAEFLLPERDVKMDFYQVDLQRLANLKRYWKVSMASLLTRAKELEMITPNRARYLWTQMSKAGYRKREPVELDVTGEVPRLFYEVIEAHQTELGYSVEDLRTLLPLNDDELGDCLQDPLRPRPKLRLISSA